MSSKDVKQQLLDFINKKAFDPILKANPNKFNEKDRESSEDVRRKTKSEKKQFNEDYKTADEIKKTI